MSQLALARLSGRGDTERSNFGPRPRPTATKYQDSDSSARSRLDEGVGSVAPAVAARPVDRSAMRAAAAAGQAHAARGASGRAPRAFERQTGAELGRGCASAGAVGPNCRGSRAPGSSPMASSAATSRSVSPGTGSPTGPAAACPSVFSDLSGIVWTAAAREPIVAVDDGMAGRLHVSLSIDVGAINAPQPPHVAGHETSNVGPTPVQPPKVYVETPVDVRNAVAGSRAGTSVPRTSPLRKRPPREAVRQPHQTKTGDSVAIIGTNSDCLMDSVRAGVGGGISGAGEGVSTSTRGARVPVLSMAAPGARAPVDGSKTVAAMTHPLPGGGSDVQHREIAPKSSPGTQARMAEFFESGQSARRERVGCPARTNTDVDGGARASGTCTSRQSSESGVRDAAVPGRPSSSSRSRPSVSSQVRYSVAVYAGNKRCEDRHFGWHDPHKDMYVFGVLDGHGGALAATFAAKHLPQILLKRVTLGSTGEHIRAALKASFLECDRAFLTFLRNDGQRRPGGRFNAGCCALVSVIKNGQLYVANAGDCRAVLISKPKHSSNKSWKPVVMPLSVDQNCSNADEVDLVRTRSSDPNPIRQSRSEKRRGVVGPLRVAGSLIVTRAIGDGYLKTRDMAQACHVGHVPYITAEPEITEHALGDADVALLMASDGVWEVISNDEAGGAVYDVLSRRTTGRRTPRRAASQASASQAVVDSVLSRVASQNGLTAAMLATLPYTSRRDFHDDITALVVNLEPGLRGVVSPVTTGGMTPSGEPAPEVHGARQSFPVTSVPAFATGVVPDFEANGFGGGDSSTGSLHSSSAGSRRDGAAGASTGIVAATPRAAAQELSPDTGSAASVSHAAQAPDSSAPGDAPSEGACGSDNTGVGASAGGGHGGAQTSAAAPATPPRRSARLLAGRRNLKSEASKRSRSRESPRSAKRGRSDPS